LAEFTRVDVTGGGGGDPARARAER
jgi:hypothetical protein